MSTIINTNSLPSDKATIKTMIRALDFAIAFSSFVGRSADVKRFKALQLVLSAEQTEIPF